MKIVWSDQSKYDKWLLIELAVCEAWSEAGVIPPEDMEKLSAARYDIDRLNEVLRTTKHDMTAFLRSVTEQLGPEGRWLHLGLTTSDVWDTATSLQMVDAANLLIEEASLCIDALGIQASRHKGTLMMGRTHGVHAEPTTFGLKLALWWDEMRRNRIRLIHARDEIAVGKISGPVGTHATVPPGIEASVCDRLGLSAALVSNQVIQRDRHANFVTTLAVVAASLEKFATEIRGSAENGNQGGRRAFLGRPDRIVFDAAQAKSRAKRADLRTGAADTRSLRYGPGERRVVGRT